MSPAAAVPVRPPHPPTHKPPHTCPLTPTDPQAGTKEKEEAHIPAITIQFGGFYVLNGDPSLDEEPLAATSPRPGLIDSATYPNWLIIRGIKYFSCFASAHGRARYRTTLCTHSTQCRVRFLAAHAHRLSLCITAARHGMHVAKKGSYPLSNVEHFKTIQGIFLEHDHEGPPWL